MVPMRLYLKYHVKLWFRDPRYAWHNLWEPLWERWVENAHYAEHYVDDDEYDYSLEIHPCLFNPLKKWQIRLLSIVFNYDYWYYEEVENCPWTNEVKEFGIPYHSRF